MSELGETIKGVDKTLSMRQTVIQKKEKKTAILGETIKGVDKTLSMKQTVVAPGGAPKN